MADIKERTASFVREQVEPVNSQEVSTFLPSSLRVALLLIITPRATTLPSRPSSPAGVTFLPSSLRVTLLRVDHHPLTGQRARRLDVPSGRARAPRHLRLREAR